jgi:mono/diheme cytochrome c family protein
MKDNSRLKPYEASIFFADGHSDRPWVEGTVPYGSVPDDTVLNTGKADGKLVDYFPFKVTPEVLARGRERYNIYCMVCHDAAGSGNGMVALRGFKPAPASFHTDRLRKVPAGYFFDVITNGFGAMADYRAQIEVEDRWAIAAYVRALQLSQNAVINDVPEAQKTVLEKKV